MFLVLGFVVCSVPCFSNLNVSSDIFHQRGQAEKVKKVVMDVNKKEMKTCMQPEE